MSKKMGTGFIIAGLILVLAAVGLFAYNRWEEALAADAADNVLAQLQKEIPMDKNPTQENTTTTMPTLQIDGCDYIGYVSIPSLSLELPVMDSWDYTKLKTAPCHYYGSYKTDDLVIAGHNYKKHFGGLKNLNVDSRIYFTDADGNIHTYTVVAIEVLKPNDTLQMVESEFDLTLYTCTYGGGERVTVRCKRIK